MRMLSIVRISSLALSGVLLAACGSTDQQTADTKIIGGQDVPAGQADARRFSTVALTTALSRSGADSLIAAGHSFCSGTVIAPRVIMTAAHCLQAMDAASRTKLPDLVLPAETDFLVSFDVKVSEAGTWRRAARVVPHPGWDPNQTLTPQPTAAPNDIGLIILDSSIPEQARPARIASVATPISTDQQIHLAGYGVSRNRNDNDTGTLRQITVPVTGVDATAQRIGVGALFRGACAGDSGGPAYIDVDGGMQVVGATSTGAEIAGNCLGLMNNYTDARYQTDWINSVLVEAGLPEL